MTSCVKGPETGKKTISNQGWVGGSDSSKSTYVETSSTGPAPFAQSLLRIDRVVS